MNASPNIVPLSGGFIITSILGFIISAIYIYPRSSQWGFTFVLFFTLLFIAGMISLTYSQVEPNY